MMKFNETPLFDFEKEGLWHTTMAAVRPAKVLGDHHLIDRLRGAFARGIARAVTQHDTPALFDWLLALFQLQGFSDARAFGFIERHGPVRWADIAADLASAPACGRLRACWRLEGCGYRKEAATCAAPLLMAACPLPRRPLRNGRLSQGAVALFLFLRDVCGDDLVGWIDDRLARADNGDPSDPSRARAMRASLLDPMREIFWVSDKVFSMTLADLLLGADPDRER